MGEIELGDKVKDKISGFTGVVVSKTTFINGCVQFGVVPKVKPGDDKYPEEVGIDEHSLVVVKKNYVEDKKDDTGGSVTRNISCRGY